MSQEDGSPGAAPEVRPEVVQALFDVLYIGDPAQLGYLICTRTADQAASDVGVIRTNAKPSSGSRGNPGTLWSLPKPRF